MATPFFFPWSRGTRAPLTDHTVGRVLTLLAAPATGGHQYDAEEPGASGCCQGEDRVAVRALLTPMLRVRAVCLGRGAGQGTAIPGGRRCRGRVRLMAWRYARFIMRSGLVAAGLLVR